MNASDLVHSLLTGKWRLERQYLKEVRKKLYAGANPGTKRDTPNRLSAPEDPKNSRERGVMLRAGRQMEEDFPFFDQILHEFETYTVGDCVYTPLTGDKDADAVIRDFWEVEADTIDYSGKFDLAKLARLAVRGEKRDGELGWRPHQLEGRIYIEAVGGDRIGDPNQAYDFSEDYYNGITVDPRTLAPRSYRIFRRNNKTGLYEFNAEVPAINFLHYFSPFRVDQMHGVTAFKNTISNGYDINQITDFTKLNMKYRASQLPYVKTETGKPSVPYEGYGAGPGAPVAEQGKGPHIVSEKIDGVTSSYFKLEESVMEYPNDFPNQQFQPLMDHLKRDCASGVKIPLEFFYQSINGGVIHRFFADKAIRTFDEEKRWLKRCLLNPVKNRALLAAVASKRLDLSRFGKLASSPALLRGTWQLGREVSVDYGNEVRADIEQMDAGVLPYDDYVESQGLDPRVVWDKVRARTRQLIAEAKAIAAEEGVTWQEVMPFLNKKFPNPAPVTGSNAPGGSPPPEEDNPPAPVRR